MSPWIGCDGFRNDSLRESPKRETFKPGEEYNFGPLRLKVRKGLNTITFSITNDGYEIYVAPKEAKTLVPSVRVSTIPEFVTQDKKVVVFPEGEKIGTIIRWSDRDEEALLNILGRNAQQIRGNLKNFFSRLKQWWDKAGIPSDEIRPPRGWQ